MLLSIWTFLAYTSLGWWLSLIIGIFGILALIGLMGEAYDDFEKFKQDPGTLGGTFISVILCMFLIPAGYPLVSLMNFSKITGFNTLEIGGNFVQCLNKGGFKVRDSKGDLKIGGGDYDDNDFISMYFKYHRYFSSAELASIGVEEVKMPPHPTQTHEELIYYGILRQTPNEILDKKRIEKYRKLIPICYTIVEQNGGKINIGYENIDKIDCYVLGGKIIAIDFYCPSDVVYKSLIEKYGKPTLKRDPIREIWFGDPVWIVRDFNNTYYMTDMKRLNKWATSLADMLYKDCETVSKAIERLNKYIEGREIKNASKDL